MKRRSLCRKKVLAIIFAAALCMTHVTPAMAEQVAAVTEKTHEAEVTAESAGNDNGNPAVVVSMENGDDVDVKITGNAETTDKNGRSKELSGVYTTSSGDGSEASVEVGGNVTVTSTSTELSDDAVAVGVNASAYSGGDTDVSAGNVAVETGRSAVGVNASAGTGGDTEVNVHSIGVNGDYGANGIIAGSHDNNSSSSTVNATGDILALSTYGNATGVVASSEGGGTTHVNVDGKIQTVGAGYTTGVYSESQSGSTEVRVKGEVSSSSSGAIASGISAVMGGGTSDVTVEKTVSATGYTKNTEYDAVGIAVLKDENSGNGITNIKAGAVSSHSNEVMAYGINLQQDAIRDGGELKIVVDGSVNAEAPEYLAIGIYANTGKDGAASISVKDDVDVTGIASEGVHVEASEGNLEIDIQGNIIQNGPIGQAVVYEDSGDASAKDHTAINVGKDITADNTAVYVSKSSGSSQMSLEVQGTVSGGEHNIVLVGESKTENLDITVWKVDISDNKNVVETENTEIVNEQPKYTYLRNEEAEKKINYIIKVDQPSDYGINLSGTTKNSNDLDTAHEGDKVYLNVDIPQGYNVEFYDINKNSSYSIVPNGYGGAYLVVPRGGGVQVGVTLTRIQTDPGNTNTSQMGDDVTGGEGQSENTVQPGVDESGGRTSGNNDISYDDGDSEGSIYIDKKQSDNNNTLSGFPNNASAILGLQITAVDSTGSGTVLSVGDVLKPVDTLTAINNFAASGTSTMGTGNIMGAGVVNFNGAFAGSATDTVELPVPANVSAGREYTVLLSNGPTIKVQCLMDGVLNIPFDKNAAGLTFMIYGREMNPSMFINS
ncbi:MAG: hypothetical protein E7232_03390 [Lachnospiraceae bacterium]|jgi:hypothetical protein|nr:hypothetical protein [Lachnospiraceae bacterium]